MTTILHEHRLEAVLDVVTRIGARHVLDLGCGTGDLTVRLAAMTTIARVVSADICQGSLQELGQRLLRLPADERQKVQVLQASVVAPISDMSPFDCALMIETIEHIAPFCLPDVERSVFADKNCAHVVVTTPNADYNARLGVPATRFRHPDHRFEWTRAEFRGWADGVSARTGYTVCLRDVGGADARLGGPSQMAVFQRS